MCDVSDQALHIECGNMHIATMSCMLELALNGIESSGRVAAGSSRAQESGLTAAAWARLNTRGQWIFPLDTPVTRKSPARPWNAWP
jgi:hypothetical protein